MMHRIAAAVVLLLAAAAPAQTRYALLIGVGKYHPAQLTNLPYAEADVTELASVLVDKAGYKSGNVMLMTHATAANDLSLAPESKKIREKLDAFVELCEPRDTLLVAFAGHGVQFAKERDSYFCPADANLDRRDTLLPLADVYARLKSCKAGLKLLLVDACRDDPRAKVNRSPTVNLESNTRPQAQVPPGGVAAFFSCSAGEKAFESPDLKHGVFFHFVIEAFRGKAADAAGVVTVPDLEKFVKPQVKTFVLSKFSGSVQRPEMNNQTIDLLPLADSRPPAKPTVPIKFAGLFAEGVVLQRDVPVPVWGTAGPGATVTVRYGPPGSGAQAQTTAGPDGRWRVTLPKLAKSTNGRYLMASSAGQTIRIGRVQVGDVWLVAGQLNVEQPLRDLPDGAKVVETADLPHVRVFSVSKTTAAAPAADVAGAWTVVSPTTAGGVSAEAFYFARELYKAIDVPIGIVEASRAQGGAQTWISWDAMRVESSLKGYVADSAGTFNGMIAPLVPFALRGVVWHHGGLSAVRPAEYGPLLQTLIRDWRVKWAADLPFVVVQLTGLETTVPLSELREAQAVAAVKLPKVGLVVTTDLGTATKGIVKKEPLGQRLALQARAVVYGEKLVASGPTYKSSNRIGNGSHVLLHFDNAVGGLEVRGDKLLGFEVCGEDKVFHPAEAILPRRNPDRVNVSSDKVPKPVAVRYNWANVPTGNLFNKEGLPAAPFRTDVP